MERFKTVKLQNGKLERKLRIMVIWKMGYSKVGGLKMECERLETQE